MLCKCGRPLQVNYVTQKLYAKCPVCRIAANKQWKKHQAKQGHLKGVARL